MDKLRKDPFKALAAYKTEGDGDKLAKLLEKASAAYYNTGESLLSDDIFDMAKDHLTKIAPSHPFLQQVGAPIAAGDKVTLPYWMGSMDKIRDDPKALDKWVDKYDGEYVISDKLDGNSGMIVYDSQLKPKMYSRGDGKVGQDISHLLPFIQGVPKKGVVTTPGLAVRGELIISKKNWDTISDLGANARNVVAGALHKKKPKPEIATKIDFVAYDMVNPRTTKPSVSFDALAKLGFIVVSHKTLSKKDLTMDNLSKILMDRRNSSPYECDGIIVAHNENHPIVANSNPKYAFAFKSILTHDEAEVVVSHIEWNVSKDGYIKPTIYFPPVTIAGAKIQRATGFNGSFIETNQIGPGSRIVIIRSGDVIPHVVRVLTPAASGKPQMPEIPFEWTDTHVDIVAAEKDGAEQRQRTLEHFSKTLDIPFVAAGTLKKLVDAGFDTIPRLLSITEADLLKIDGFKKVSAAKVAKSLKDVRESVTCVQMMAASNIFGRGMGEKKLQVIVKALPQILERQKPSRAELVAIEGVGPATVDSFLNGLTAFFALMDEMNMPCRSVSTKTKPSDVAHQDKPQQAKPLNNITVVFTGFRAKDWEEAITAAGGKVTTSVSRNTTMIVAADPSENSSKLEKARELNIPIMSKTQFAQEYGFTS